MAKKDFRKAIGGAKSQENIISSLIRGTAKKEDLELVWLPHDKVYSVVQVRTKFKEIEGLAASMKGKTQHEAIRVFPANKDGMHRIHMGERRWRAAVINDEPVLAIIDQRLNPETYNAKNILGQIAENDQREPLTPIELARAFALLRDNFGLKTGEIAEGLGRKPAYVSKHLKLLDMPEPVQELMSDGIVTYLETLNILTNIFAASAEDGLKFVEEIRAKGEVSRDEAQTKLNILKGKAVAISAEQVNPDSHIETISDCQDVKDHVESIDTNNSLPVPDERSLPTQDTSETSEASDVTENVQSIAPQPTTEQIEHTPNSGRDNNTDNGLTNSFLPSEPDEEIIGQNNAELARSDVLNQIAASRATVYVLIDGVEHILLDKPSYTENGEEYVSCQVPGSLVIEVPVSECVLSRVTLTK